MNKFERRVKGHYKFKKRLRNYKINPTEMLDADKDSVWHALKTSGKPCSCWLCRDEKYKRKVKHKNQII